MQESDQEYEDESPVRTPKRGMTKESIKLEVQSLLSMSLESSTQIDNKLNDIELTPVN